jgi:hypothetical protein
MEDDRALIRARNFGFFLYRYCHNDSEAHNSGKSPFLLRIKSVRSEENLVTCYAKVEDDHTCSIYAARSLQETSSQKLIH